MPRILVLYYSAYGETEALARAVAEGAAEVPGAWVEVERVPELVPEELARSSGYRLDQLAPVASPEKLAEYDAVIFGSPSRFGTMAAQMRSFLNRTGALWSSGRMVDILGSVFLTGAAQQLSPSGILHSFYGTMQHLGMRIAEPPSVPGQLPDPPTLAPDEIQRARAHGRWVASLAKQRAA
jgi:NAD(P)H dehydrogenase (quinone)